MVTNRRDIIKIEKYIKALLSLNVFNCFTEEELLEAFNQSAYKIKQYSKGEIVHLQNEKSETMDVILEGELSVQKIDEEGNILKVVVFSSGDIVGTNLLFSSSNHYPMTVVSDVRTIILHISKELILELSRRNVGCMDALLREVSDKALVLTNKIDDMSLKTIREKVNDFLNYESNIQNSKQIKLTMSKKELAQRMGVQRSSLSRELNKMRQDGLVEYNASSITIK